MPVQCEVILLCCVSVSLLAHSIVINLVLCLYAMLSISVPLWMLQTFLKTQLSHLRCWYANSCMHSWLRSCSHVYVHKKARNHVYMCMCTKTPSCSHTCIHITAISRHLYVNMNCKYELDHAHLCMTTWACMVYVRMSVIMPSCVCTHECAHGRTFL